MKLAGQKVDAPKEQVVVIPRESGNLVFKAAAVLNYDDFEKLCPKPVIPVKIFPGGGQQENVEDPTYKKELDTWAERRVQFMVIRSLAATPDLEWETVKLDQPDTWKDYEKELKEGLSDVEVGKIFECVTTACGLNQEQIEEATRNFLASQGAVQSPAK